MTENAIHWVAQFTIHDSSRLEEFKERAAETVATVKATEPKALAYEWHISEDGRHCHVDEWFDGTEGALAHLRGQGVTENLPRLLEMSDFTGLYIYSPISDPELREALASFGAVFTSHWGGFTR